MTAINFLHQTWLWYMQLVNQQPVQCPHSLTVQQWYREGRSAFTTSQPVVDRDVTQCAPGAAVEIYLDQLHRSTYLQTFLFCYGHNAWQWCNNYAGCIQDSQSGSKQLYQWHVYQPNLPFLASTSETIVCISLAVKFFYIFTIKALFVMSDSSIHCCIAPTELSLYREMGAW